MRSRSLGFVAAAGILCPRADAAAGPNDQPYPVGELAGSMGGAAAAIVQDASAPWYNPAGLGRVSVEGISANVSAYGLQFERVTKFFNFPDLPKGDLSGRGTTLFPSSAGYVKPLDVKGGNGWFRHAVGIAIVTPDYDHHEAVLDVPTTILDFELRGRERLVEQTLWVMPGWGGCLGPTLCVGAGVAGTYRTADGLYIFSQQATLTSGARLAYSDVEQQEVWSVGAGFQVGAQWQPSPGVWLGASVRSPVRTLLGGGTLLILDSQIDPTDPMAGTQVRRVEDKHLRVDTRLPALIRLGVGYLSPGWRLAADVQLSLPQDDYASVRGSGGVDYIQPRDPEGNPLGAPVQVGENTGRDAILNASVGLQYVASKKVSLQGGLFTDRSGLASADEADELHPKIDRFGATLGVARRGSRSAIYLGAVGTIGTGKAVGIGVDPKYRASASTRAVLLTLGGSTDFGEPDDDERAGPAPDPSPPLYSRWWFWSAVGVALVGGVVATVIAAERPSLAETDLGTQGGFRR